jgi:hypothetical protein
MQIKEKRKDKMQIQVSSRTEQFRLEYIDSKQLAARWGLPETWIREKVRRRTTDPLPHVRFGKYVRFQWGSPELESWAERRMFGSDQAVLPLVKETIQ